MSLLGLGRKSASAPVNDPFAERLSKNGLSDTAYLF